jgi:putative endonuclease
MCTPGSIRPQQGLVKDAFPVSRPEPLTPASTPSLRTTYYVYILTNHTRMFYIGMTDDIRRRTLEHKIGFHKDSFTEKYRLNQLVYYEEAVDSDRALSREKQLKGWSRRKKISLIEGLSPHWTDLSERWYSSEQLVPMNERSRKKWDLSFDHLA